MKPLEVPLEEQILTFQARLAQWGLGGALKLLNDRRTFRYTALYVRCQTAASSCFRPCASE
jgi:hypothetical protein